MHNRDLVRLIGGPYLPPRVRVGDIETCLYRDCDVVVTSWTDARIPWPRCRARDQRGGAGLLINDTMLKAISTESAEAIKYWFGVSTNAVWAWRKAFGIGQRGTPGSKRLYDSTAQKVGDSLRGKRLSAKAVRQRRRRAIDLDLGKHLRKFQDQQRAERAWTNEEAALLGTMRDTELAKKLRRTWDDVRRERVRRGIAKYRKPLPPEAALSPEEREQLRRSRIAAAKRGKRRPSHLMLALWEANRGSKRSKGTRAKMLAAAKRRAAAGIIPNGRLWTAKEDKVIRTLSAPEAARQTGRTLTSVYSRRIKLGIGDGRATNGRKPTTIT